MSAVACRRYASGSVLLVALLAGGCATTGGAEHDPFEPMNRSVQRFNDALDESILRPTAQAYVDVVPSAARKGVNNFFGNLGDIWSSVNHLLQGKVEGGLNQGMRVAVNSVFGLLGVLDVATEMGLDRRKEDFGQTLGVWGLPAGPYLVLPLLGPSSVRDGVGVATGYALDPAPSLSDTRERNAAIGLQVVDMRTQFLGADRLLEDAALDRYAFIRDAYLQRRRNLVYDGNPPDDEESDDWYEEWEEEERARQEGAGKAAGATGSTPTGSTPTDGGGPQPSKR